MSTGLLLLPALLMQPATAEMPPEQPSAQSAADEEEPDVPDVETGKLPGRRRPGYQPTLPDPVTQRNPGAVRAPPPEAFPADQFPVPDRWRIMTGLCPRRNGDQSILEVFKAMRDVCHSSHDPYHQNTLQGRSADLHPQRRGAGAAPHDARGGRGFAASRRPMAARHAARPSS